MQKINDKLFGGADFAILIKEDRNKQMAIFM